MAHIRRSTIGSFAGADWVCSTDFRRVAAQGPQARAGYDRRDASEGASRRREPFKKGPVPRRIGRTKGGLNSKLHAVCDGNGRPLVMLLSEGQMSDYKGAALMLPAMPEAKQLLADKGYDADWSAPPSPSAASPPAFLRNPTEKSRSPMTPASTNSATRSKTCSDGSRLATHPYPLRLPSSASTTLAD
jgi:hypothetical protein